MPRHRGKLNGKKTYIMAAATVVASWLGYLVGEPVLGQDAATLADAIQLTVVALLAATLRHGMHTEIEDQVAATGK